MTSRDIESQPAARTSAGFATTHWSIVLRAADSTSPASADALEKLCLAYWYPLYAFLRRKGYAPPDAEDLVQEFLRRVLAGHGLRRVEQGHGRFRSYLLAALRHFLINEWDKAQAEKRGGGLPVLSLEEFGPEDRCAEHLADDANPETLYERAWAATVLERVRNRLWAEYQDAGKTDRFDRLEEYLMSECGNPTYAETGRQLGVTEGAVKAEVRRLRQRYCALLRAEIAHTVASPAEIDEELRFLIAVVSR